MSSASGPARTREPPRGGTRESRGCSSQGSSPSDLPPREQDVRTTQTTAPSCCIPVPWGCTQHSHGGDIFRAAPCYCQSMAKVLQPGHSCPTQQSSNKSSRAQSCTAAARSSFLPLCLYRCHICIVLCATRLSHLILFPLLELTH